jgi:hypothetical protein
MPRPRINTEMRPSMPARKRWPWARARPSPQSDALPAACEKLATARAAYTAWSSEARTDSRLMTNAVTRDQQASRAFAAETLVPIAYIRSQAKGSKLAQHLMYDIACNASVEVDVVRKQALNNGLQIVSI